jgi:ATP-dependent RNA helicase RhlE
MTDSHSRRQHPSTPTSPEASQGAPEAPAISFSDLRLVQPILRALSEEAYEHPTPIQAQAIPPLLEGRDLLGCARTGTGKTAAFVLPILQLLSQRPAQGGQPSQRDRAPRGRGHGHRGPASPVRALILVPTRELAAQVQKSLQSYGRHLSVSSAVVFGGVGQGPQVRALVRGVDVLVATPGRLLDLIGQGHARLDGVEFLVLDEADRMLDLGFLPDVKRLLTTIPTRRQTLLFSATMPPAITALAGGILDHPMKVFVSPEGSTVDAIDQRVFFVDRSGKPALLAEILSAPEVERALVFTRTKRGADRVAEGLAKYRIPAVAIHGNQSQTARERALEGFRRGRNPVLVATDLAARGIDVDGITHVVNYDVPNVPESYVHRIGRTARAGAGGIAISLCSNDERAFLRDIERTTRQSIPASDRSGDASLVSTVGMGSSGERGHRHQQGGQRPGGHSNGGHKAGGGRRPGGAGGGNGSGGYRPQRGVEARGGKGGGGGKRRSGSASAAR